MSFHAFYANHIELRTLHKLTHDWPFTFGFTRDTPASAHPPLKPPSCADVLALYTTSPDFFFSPGHLRVRLHEKSLMRAALNNTRKVKKKGVVIIRKNKTLA